MHEDLHDINQHQNLNTLLNEVSILRAEYEIISASDASHFNIFSILRREHEEVALHSRFIYELLNPQGDHKMKSFFLSELLRCISQREHNQTFPVISLSNLGSSRVFREKDNIDLLIFTPDGSTIIIENKINAADQPRQLERYYQTAVRKHKRKPDQVHIFYLTLDRHEPSKNSKGKLKVPVHLISYRDEIMEWLESCVSASADHPNIKETINQYRQLVMKLTSLYEGEEKRYMDRVVKTIAETSTCFQAAMGISEALPKAKTHIMRELFRSLQRVMEHHGFYKVTSDEWDMDEIEHFYFSSGAEPYQAYSLVEFDHEGKQYSLDFMIKAIDELFYGFVYSEIRSDEYVILPRSIAKRRFKNRYKTFSLMLDQSFETNDDEELSEDLLYCKCIEAKDGEVYDFKEFNEPCVSLLEGFDENAQRIIGDVIDRIKVIKEECAAYQQE